MDERSRVVLHHLGVPNAKCLGAGATASVYALDEARAVKIHGGDDVAAMYGLQLFYQMLNTFQLPFTVPFIYEVGENAGIPYHIEKRLPGTDMSSRFPQLHKTTKRYALDAFLAALPSLHAIAFPDKPYGEVLGWGGERVNAGIWSQFLYKKLSWQLKNTLPTLRQDLPFIDDLLTHYFAQIAQIPDPPQKSLVHGDYFYANVMLDDKANISAVLDFSPLTLIGDPVMDLAGALRFTTVFDFTTPQDIAYLTQAIVKQYGADVMPRIELYTIYYSLLFSNCKEPDPPTYLWALGHLRQYWGKIG
jgi:aminoglycoside phosphotransferase (APT) family kinase protein